MSHAALVQAITPDSHEGDLLANDRMILKSLSILTEVYSSCALLCLMLVPYFAASLGLGPRLVVP
jgi:hypothetical protein